MIDARILLVALAALVAAPPAVAESPYPTQLATAGRGSSVLALAPPATSARATSARRCTLIPLTPSR